MSWYKDTLGEVSEKIQTGPFGSQLHQSDYRDEGVPVIMPKDMLEGRISTLSIARISKEHVERLNQHKVKSGDIIYSRRGDVGKCALITNKEEDWLCGTGCLKVTLNPNKIIPKFAFYQLQRKESIGWLINHAVGSTMLNLNTSILTKLPIEITDLDKQQSIVNVLASYDDLIENNQKQIKLLEEAAQRLYKEWFVNLRFPGHENGEIVDAIPLGWHEDTIDTKVNLLNGFAFKSKDLEESGLFKLVTIKNVQDGYFEGKNVKYLSKIPDKMPRHCYLNEGDLLLSLTGNVGRVCIVEGNDFLLNQRVAKISSETPAYTYCLFRSDELFIKINNIANGAAQQNVSPIRIGKIKHLFPNDKLIMDFERVAGPILKRVVLMKKNIILLEESRDRLLPKLMSGEIEV